ncbi:MAG: FHA domain-containing protein [Sedimentisphaerales bacterium]|jgi:pSer/pThr/pTyr-binding forkhead associated (FHA) protein
MASLIVLDGPQKDDYYPLGRRTNVIGRDEALMIQILDERVSRKHLQISYDKDKNEYRAIDMSSKHGVLINGNKIKEETCLVDGDYITIGAITLWFTVSDFPDKESALSHYKKVGERSRPTFIG